MLLLELRKCLQQVLLGSLPRCLRLQLEQLRLSLGMAHLHHRPPILRASALHQRGVLRTRLGTLVLHPAGIAAPLQVQQGGAPQPCVPAVEGTEQRLQGFHICGHRSQLHPQHIELALALLDGKAELLIQQWEFVLLDVGACCLRSERFGPRLRRCRARFIDVPLALLEHIQLLVLDLITPHSFQLVACDGLIHHPRDDVAGFVELGEWIVQLLDCMPPSAPQGAARAATVAELAESGRHECLLQVHQLRLPPQRL
mmetsp:Transcript_64786/g.168485  ORF Transcript_64786/g.168485 Transcript_64786/m.168485 type:complete len:256 (-) Transcript_64786:195-962(-)